MLRRPSRVLARALIASVPALALALAFGPAAGASTAKAAAASPSASAAATARTAIEHLAIGQHGADHRVSGHAQTLKGLTQVESGNWSGYADTGSGFSKATGSWTEPSVTCSGRTTSLAAFWVGIDGYSSDSVEQDGTLAECYEGSAYYYTWWEMYPTNDIQVVGETLRPGDAIAASVTRSGTSYTLKVTDSSRSGDNVSTTQTCSCANSSAEWIAEAPSGSSGVYPLAHFSTFSLSGATVSTTSTSGTISSFTDDEITMVDSSGRVEAQPGALNGSGNAFSVTWERST
jgi:Peptidase A4 family